MDGRLAPFLRAVSIIERMMTNCPDIFCFTFTLRIALSNAL